jgi:peptidoglycan/LPS O-acetylase OafA/YrhL
MTSPHARAPWVDAIKLMAAQIIVWHHLCAYGPLSDAAASFWPEIADVLYNKGRLAVQVFLVLAGYLAAQGLARVRDWSVGGATALALKRYRRLAWPLCVALVLAIAAAAITDNVLPSSMASAAVELPQFLAHLFMLQGVLGMESLSAGVWYVAIDFQLFLLLLLCFAMPVALTSSQVQARRWTQTLTVGLMLASLWGLNLMPAWDNWAPYFFGSYGLGVCAHWASQSTNKQAWWTGLVIAVWLALLIDFRGRILLAGITAWALMALGQPGHSVRDRHQMAWLINALHAGAERSYALFLVHFPVLLLANGLWVESLVFLNIEPDPISASIALVFTWLAAWALAHVFYTAVEAKGTLRPSWTTSSVRPRVPLLKLPHTL